MPRSFLLLFTLFVFNFQLNACGCFCKRTKAAFNVEDITIRDWNNLNFTGDIFVDVATRFISQNLEKLCDEASWFGEVPITELSYLRENYTLETQPKPYLAFIEKCVIPSNIKIICWGDIHGQFETTKSLLSRMKFDELIDNDFYLKSNIGLVDLGDMFDRGNESLRIFATLMLIAIKNPGKVFLIRGNHENIYESINNYELMAELRQLETSKNSIDQIKQIATMATEMLPLGLLLGYAAGNNITLFQFLMHGAPDIYIDLRDFLNYKSETLARCGGKIFYNLRGIFFDYKALYESLQEYVKDPDAYIKKFATHYTNMYPCQGLYWNDICFTKRPLQWNKSRNIPMPQPTFIELGINFIKTLMNKNSTPQSKICGVVRAHQHDLIKKLQGISIKNLSQAAVLTNVDLGTHYYFNNSATTVKDNFTIVTLMSGPIKINQEVAVDYLPTYLKIGINPDESWTFESASTF